MITQSMDSLQAITGFPPRKKVRRGGGRHKGPVSSPSPDEHLENAKAAMDKGDHAAAKTSALHLVKALHKLSAKPKP